MPRTVASRPRFVTLAPPRPILITLGVLAIGVIGFIATAVPLSAPPEAGWAPFLQFSLLLGAAFLGMTALISSRVSGGESELRILDLVTERRIPIAEITAVESRNGLYITVGDKSYGCVGYGSSLFQEMRPSKRYARAGAAVSQWVAARRTETTPETGRSQLKLRRWLLVGPPVCFAAALTYTTILWAVAAPIRAALWPSP